MRLTQYQVILTVQRLLASVAYFCSKSTNFNPAVQRALIGPLEIAGLVQGYKAMLGSDAIAVSLAGHPFKYSGYDFAMREQGFRGKLIRALLGPLVLGWCAARVDRVVYAGRGSYFADLDYRWSETSFLKKRNLILIQISTGTDFRSPRLSRVLMEQLQTPNLGHVQFSQLDEDSFQAVDRVSKAAASVVNQNFDLVLDFPSDQCNYIEMDLKAPFIYPVTRELEQTPSWSKFSDSSWTVIHAPSNPEIKGTDHIRRAVGSLKDEGFDFEYLELEGVPFSTVAKKLSQGQIVVNELYGWSPGSLGIEAMQAGCALITRANRQLEPWLPAGAEEAWISAGPDDLLSQLRKLLLNPSLTLALAKKGHQWQRDHYNSEVLRKTLLDPKLKPVVRHQTLSP